MPSVTESSSSIFTWSAEVLSLPPAPVPNSIQRSAEAIRQLLASGTPDERSSEDLYRLIEQLYYAVSCWTRRPQISLLLKGLLLPFCTNEDRARARRLLPHILFAIEDAEAEYMEQVRLAAPDPGDRDAERKASSEKENPVTELKKSDVIVAMAADKYGYRGPENRGHAVRDIEHALHRIGRSGYHQTIRKYLDEGAERVEDGHWPDN